MPRRSFGTAEESPIPRRTSARIAAVQAASPAKSPAKSPRRKRQSTEAAKNASEDTESQQSQIKSESSVEELNGVETSSSVKDHESVSDIQELPPKKQKVDEEPEHTAEIHTTDTVTESAPVADVCEASDPPADFEVVEKTDLPASDSVEVEAAVSVQGEGQLLVGYVQVDKDELPAATSIEVQQTPVEEKPTDQPVNTIVEETPVVPIVPESTLNGDHIHTTVADAATEETTESTSSEIQAKVCSMNEVPVESTAVPAAGDSTINMVSVDPVPQ